MLDFAGLSDTVLFQILAFSAGIYIFIFMCRVTLTAQGNWHEDDTVFALR